MDMDDVLDEAISDVIVSAIDQYNVTQEKIRERLLLALDDLNQYFEKN